MNKVEYLKSTKKVYIICAIHIALMFVGLSLSWLYGASIPVSMNVTIFLFVYMVVVGGLWFYALRRAMSASCTFCGADLYYIIEVSKNQNIATNFCIKCGSEIKI